MCAADEFDYLQVGLTTVFYVTDWQSATREEEIFVSVKGVCSLGWQGCRNATLQFRLGDDNDNRLRTLMESFFPGSYHKIEAAHFTVYPDEIGFDEPYSQPLTESEVALHVSMHREAMRRPIEGASAPLALQQMLVDRSLQLAEMACGKTLTHLRSRDLRKFFERTYGSFFSFSATVPSACEIKTFIQKSVHQVLATLNAGRDIEGVLLRLVGPGRYFERHELLIEIYLREAFAGRYLPSSLYVDLKIVEDQESLGLDLILCV